MDSSIPKKKRWSFRKHKIRPTTGVQDLDKSKSSWLSLVPPVRWWWEEVRGDVPEDDDTRTYGDDRTECEDVTHPGSTKRDRSESIVQRKPSNENRRVTLRIDAPREEEEDTTTICPIPSITDIQDEANGTYKDAKQAFHQVMHAFVIAPEDIDRMSDTIRDAEVEFKENYPRNVKVHYRTSTGGVTNE